MQRGVIRNRDYAGRLKDFSGLVLNGTITPTDIDGMYEYRDRCFVFFEGKHEGSDLLFGQRLAFERLIDALSKSKPAIFFVVEYGGGDDDIDYGFLIVRKYYFQEGWHDMEQRFTLREATIKFIHECYGHKEKGWVFMGQENCDRLRG